MKNQLKVGQKFEVVEVLTDGGYNPNPFNIGGHTVSFKNNGLGLYVLINGLYAGEKTFLSESLGCCVLYNRCTEVKKVGRLTVTKIKKS